MSVTPTCVNSLLELCRNAGLIEENDLQRLLSTTHLPDEPVEAAAILVANDLLTRFQVSQLLTGRHRGLQLGRYKVLDKLGHGSWASVFLCEQAVTRRKVAVKVLPECNARDPGIRGRFYREARAAVLLDHPNIVRTHEIDSDGDVHYLAMEYVDGADLQRVLERDGPLSYARAVGYAIQAAFGLEHAHQKGLVHRDIKPANLLLSTLGIVKVLDMGLARFFRDPNDDLTQQYDQGAVLGTVDFLAPEQAMASSKVDARADIYSLGATLYTLIAGKTPFEGTVTQKLFLVQVRVPPALAQVRPEVPAALSAVVAKMMAKNLQERYQSAAEVIERLTPFAAADEQAKVGTIIAPKTTAATRLIPPTATAPTTLATTATLVGLGIPGASEPKSAKRNGWLSVGGVILGVLVIIGLALVANCAKPRPSPRPNVMQTAAAGDLAEQAETAVPEP